MTPRVDVEDSRRSTFDFPITDKERAWRILDVLRPAAEAHATSVATVALAWILSQPFVTSIIIGAKREDQLQQNLAARELQLTADQIRQLDEVSTRPPAQLSSVIEPTAPGVCPMPNSAALN